MRRQGSLARGHEPQSQVQNRTIGAFIAAKNAVLINARNRQI
jgi:hypothetical protein